MAITLTGGKYANNTISTVGTTSVTATTANFVSTDFAVQRIVGMWNSAGTTFLGMAFVRAFVSTSVLQLETAFYDPATGATVTQTAGNVIIVSKNFTDSVTTNLTVSNGVVTVGDVLIYGSSSSATGICFYDQDVTLNLNYTTTSGTTYITQSLLGGLVVFGKLENYANNVVSQPVNINYGSGLNTAGQGSLYGFVTNYASSNFIYYGGVIAGNGISIPIYHGGYNGTAGYTMVLNGVTCAFDLISPGAGGTWGTYASRMQLINCYTETAFANAIGRRWGDGTQSGGSFKFPYNTNQPISALGANSGNFSFAAPPGQRATILDFGANQITPGSSSTGGPVLTRGGPNAYWAFTNLIATSYWAGTGQTQGGNTVTADTSSTNTLYFQDTFSNLASGSVGNINTTGITSSSSIYSTAATTSWSPSLLYSVTTGFSVTTSPPSAWYYGLKCYGKQVVSGVISPTTYALIGANGPNVSFQQTVNQLADTGVGSVTQTTANAYTSIATLDQLYAASSNWSSLSAANAAYPSISAYPITYSGSQLNLGNINLVLATSGSAFSINTSTNTLTINCTTLAAGTIFTSFTTTGTVTFGSGTSTTVPYVSSAGTSGVVTLTNLVAGSTVVTDAGVATTSSGTSVTIYTTPGTYPTFHYAVTKFGYLPIYGTVSGTSGAVSVTVSQASDPGVTQTTQSTVVAYTSLSTLDQLYDYWSYYLYTGAAGSGPTQYLTNLKSGAWSGAPLSKAGTAISLLSAITTLTLSTGTITNTAATSSSALTIAGVASTLSPGATTFASLSAASVTSLTNTGIALQIPYTVSAGTSGVITLNNLVSGSIVISDLGTSSTSSGTSLTMYSGPGVNSTLHYAVTRYGYSPVYGTIAGTSGAVSATVSQSADTGITQATQATVAAYSTLSTLDNVYDYWSYYLYATTTGATQYFTYLKAGTWSGAPLSKSGTAISLLSTITNLTLSTAAISGTTASSATNLAICGIAANLAVGASTFQTLTASGVTTFTLTGVTPQFVYTINSGTSLAVSLTVPTGSAVALLSGGAIVSGSYTAATSGTSYTFYTTPGQTGTWAYKVAKYGSLPSSNTFTPSGQVTASVSLSTDTGITQSTVATVSAYSNLSTPDQLYDYAAYWQTTSNTGGIAVTNPCSKSGTSLSLGSNSLTLSTSASSQFAYSGSAITVKSAATFATGVTYTSFATSSTVTLTGVVITCVYTTSAGTSTVLTLTNLPYTSANGGSYVSIVNNSSSQVQYIGPVTSGTQTVYIAPTSSSLSYTWKVACYGYLSESTPFSTQGYVAGTVSLSADTGITQATAATVAAYTSLGTCDKLYDYAAYTQTQNGASGITITNPVVKNGTQVSLGADSLSLITSINTTITNGSASIVATNSFTAGTLVYFSATVGTSGGQVVAGTGYYVIATGLSGTAFQVSATSGGTAITFNASGTPTVSTSPYIFSVSGTSITVNSGTTFATGTTFTNIGTSSTIATTGVTITCVYATSSGTSTVLTLSSLPTYSASNGGSSIAIFNNSGSQVQYLSGISTTSQVFYIAPGAALSYSWKATCYGFLPTTTAFTTQGYVNAVASLSTDTGITQSTVGTVSGYASLSSPDQVYDYAAYWETTTTGISIARVGVKSGSQLSFGSATVTFNTAASNVYVATASTATVKTTATFTTGSTFTSFGTTGTFTNTGSNTTLTCVYATSAGSSTVLTLSNVPVGASINVANNSGVQQQFISSALATQPIYIAPQASATWTWKIAFYGNISQTGSFTTSGYQNATASLATDTGITQGTAATVAAYGTLSSCDQLYDYAAYYETTSTGIQVSRPTLKNGAQVQLTGISLTINASASSVWSYSGSSLTIKATTFTTGSTFTSLGSSTTSFTLTGSTVTCVYQNASGTSGVFSLTNLPVGSSVSITNASGVSQQFIASATSPQPVYVAPGATGTWNWKVASYGSLPGTGTFTPSGYAFSVVSLSTDTGITQATKATVAAYASLGTPDQIYDYAAYWETLSSGINVTRVTTKVGSQLSFGSTAVTLSTSASNVYIATASTAVILSPATFVAGTTFTNFATTSTATLTGVTVQCVYTTSAGTATILILNVSAGSSVYITNASAVQQAFTNSSGSVFTFFNPPAAAQTWNYKVAKYGYLPQIGSVSNSGSTTLTITLSTDSGITQATQATVSAYTSLSSPDQIYDYAAYWETTNTGIPVTRITTKVGTQLSFGSAAVTFNTGASAVYAATSSTATVLTAATLTAGSTFATFATTSTVTLTGTAVQCVYTTSSGTSCVFALTNLSAGTAVYITNASNAQQSYIGSSGTSNTFYNPPQTTQTWNYKVARYGYLSQTGTFSTSGATSIAITLLADTGITQSNGTTVGGYVTLSSLDQLYDYGNYWETTNTGIPYSRPAVKSGSQIALGAVSLTANATASSVWAYTGSALTIKSSALANGVTFGSLVTTSTANFSNGAANQAVIYSSAGNSGILTLTGLSNHNVYLQNNSATQQAYVTSVTGTYTFYTPIGSTGTWTWVVKKVGYSYSFGTFTASTGGLYTAAPNTPQKLNADGSVMYTASSSPYCTVSFNGITEADILIGNAAVNCQAILDTTEAALVTNAGMVWLAANAECSQFLSSTGNYIFLTTKWRFECLNTSCPNATVNGYALSADGTPLNATNGPINFLSNILPQQVAAAVWGYLTASANTAGTFGGAVATINGGVQKASQLIPYSSGI